MPGGRALSDLFKSEGCFARLAADELAFVVVLHMDQFGQGRPAGRTGGHQPVDGAGPHEGPRIRKGGDQGLAGTG